MVNYGARSIQRVPRMELNGNPVKLGSTMTCHRRYFNNLSLKESESEPFGDISYG